MQYWMPEAEIFVKPIELGLDILMVGAEINFQVEAKFTDRVESGQNVPTQPPTV